jgi:GNAT superfamily N-acetyltransferase
MAWRDRTHNPAANRDAMATIVRDGDVPGLLAYASGEPVGWISVAPREQHPQLLRSPTLKPADPDEPGVYSITCFAVYPTARRQGVRDALLAAAIEYARARGATALEAYPSTADYAHTDYMGPTELFLSHGFVLVRNAREHRVIMRLPISA